MILQVARMAGPETTMAIGWGSKEAQVVSINILSAQSRYVYTWITRDRIVVIASVSFAIVCGGGGGVSSRQQQHSQDCRVSREGTPWCFLGF